MMGKSSDYYGYKQHHWRENAHGIITPLFKTAGYITGAFDRGGDNA